MTTVAQPCDHVGAILVVGGSTGSQQDSDGEYRIRFPIKCERCLGAGYIVYRFERLEVDVQRAVPAHLAASRSVPP